VRISAKADYAVRASAELAAAGPSITLKAEQLAHAQDIPLKFLLNILVELKHAGLVQSHRGSVGGYSLAKPSRSITIADVIRAVEGQLATGQTNKQIGTKLVISTRTVETHRAKIMLKLDMHSVSELVRYAVRTHLIQL